MKLRLSAAALLFAAVAALAQDRPTTQAASGYTSPRVDFGIVVSDIDAAKEFYEKALGFRETREFTVPGDFGKSVGLSDNLPFTVHVMQLGEGPDATQVKLMEFEGTRPRRPDNSYLHSTYGIRYLTLYVNDVTAAVERASKAGVKPVAEGAREIPAELAPGGLGFALVRDPDGNAIELVGPMGK